MAAKPDLEVTLTPEMAQSSLDSASSHWRLRAWGSAYSNFRASDKVDALKADDLERYGISAYLTDREDEFLAAFERAFNGHCEDDQRETGRGGGWLARANGLVEKFGSDCVESGYLLLPVIEQNLATGNPGAARQAAIEAVAAGVRFSDDDLVALARHSLGRVALEAGKLPEGFALLDEVMLAVTGGNLSPIVTGLIFCSVIDACHDVLDFGRTKEWTEALSDWCEAQPELVAFTGRCMIHVAEFRQFDGSWKIAEAQALSACRALVGSANEGTAGAAYYRLGEIHRLQGHFAEAEADYRNASRYGFDPQPGLSLMRALQGRLKQANSAIRRALATAKSPPKRIRLLHAYIEIMVLVGELVDAHAAVNEIGEHANYYDTDAMRAIAAQSTGLLDLAEGRADVAYAALRQAAGIWQQLGANYNHARARVLLGRACLDLGDREGGELELGAARDIFVMLGAKPDQAKVEAILRPTNSPGSDLLTKRQLEILRLIAAGNTNRVIAGELDLSERTIDRHVSNILMRLDVPTRSAATAFAYKQKLFAE